MRVMITRPREDARPLAEALAARGVETLLEPLLHLQFFELNLIHHLTQTLVFGIESLPILPDLLQLIFNMHYLIFLMTDGDVHILGEGAVQL